MSKLAQVAERIAQTRRWLDQEADRLAARLDQIEKRAPAVLQNAHRILDEHQRDLAATERMVQEWLSATAEASGGSKKSPAPQPAASATRTLPKQANDGASASLDPTQQLIEEQQKDVGRLERALQTLATEAPGPESAAAQPPHAQPGPSTHAAAAVDSRLLLDDDQKDEVGLERALQTLANKMAPQNAAASPQHVVARPQPAASPQAAAASQAARARLKQSNDAPAAVEAARRLLEESANGGDTADKQAQQRKLGVVRVA